MRDTSGQDTTVDHRPRNRRRWLMAGAVAATLVAGAAIVAPGVLRFAGSQTAVKLERLRIATVERGPFVRDLAVQGTVVAAVSPTLYAPAPGTVVLDVRAGDTVGKGQTLASVISPALENELSREQATLAGLEVGLGRQAIEARKEKLRNQQTIDLARVTVVAAERELRRAQASWDKRVISLQDLEKARDDKDKAQVEYEHARQNAELENETLDFELRTLELERDRQRLVVDNQERRVAELQLVSPVDGMVGNLAVEQRAVVGENTPVVTVVDLSALELDVRIPQNYADDLAPGLEAQITYSGTDYPGTLTAVSPEVLDNYVTGRVRFSGQTPDGLRQNQRLSVRVILDARDDTLTVSRGAFLDSGGGRVAYVVGDGLAERRAIRTGASSVSRVEIVEGLSAGERIVISGVDQFDSAETVLLTD